MTIKLTNDQATQLTNLFITLKETLPSATFEDNPDLDSSGKELQDYIMKATDSVLGDIVNQINN